MNSSNMKSSNEWNGDQALYAKMKILIIDDEPLNVLLLEDLLSENGYTRVKSVTDPRLALDACKTFGPDLILLDWLMPEVNGLAILEGLRANNSEIYLPIIVLTADINKETKRRALGAGATDFLFKPFDHLEVLLRIAHLLEIQRLRLELDDKRARLENAGRTRVSERREVQSQPEMDRPRGVDKPTPVRQSN